MKVFVVNQDGQPLMPTTPRKARLLLESGSARIYSHRPFTIQLLYHTSGYTQDITLGIDSGYENIGVSAITEKEELVSVEVKMLTGMSERLKERAIYRRQRRQYHTRYRQPRFDNRRSAKGWLAPSIVRWRLVNTVNAIHTYGHITKSARIGLGLEKSHRTDAFVIACGTNQRRATHYVIEQRRRNNRSLVAKKK